MVSLEIHSQAVCPRTHVSHLPVAPTLSVVRTDKDKSSAPAEEDSKEIQYQPKAAEQSVYRMETVPRTLLALHRNVLIPVQAPVEWVLSVRSEIIAPSVVVLQA